MITPLSETFSVKFDGHPMDKPSSLDKRSHLRVALSLRHRMQEMHWTATCASKHGKHGAKECIDTLDTMDYDGMCFSWFLVCFLHDTVMDTASQLKAPPEPDCPSHPNPR